MVAELNQDERKIFDKICNNIKSIYKNIKKSNISDEDLLSIFLHTYIELFWHTLISKAIEYSANRRYLSREKLKEQCKTYVEKNKDAKFELTKPFFDMSWKEGFRDIEVQIDYVIAVPTKDTKKEMKIENETVFVFELYRFDDSKKKESLKYISPDRMK